MKYCSRCMYPANAKPTIIFDDHGVCSGCRYQESRKKINWTEREKGFREVLNEYKAKAREAKRPYDCIIPVSGGKDSTYQAHLIKHVYGLNPLLVTFNHSFNSPLGVRNLSNLVGKLECDLIRFTANPGSARRISRHMLKKVGDLTWHYHAGIRTLPFQVSVKYKIPLIIWGEEGFSELVGMFRLEDGVEDTKWRRQEHDMRGYEPEDLVGEGGITHQDIVPYIYPTDEELETTGSRGIYMSNFIPWDARVQGDFVIKNYGFGCYEGRRDRTFNLHAKIEDHANDVHDYLKYLKFGYGRATDDASMEIRHGRMTREEGVEQVQLYDSARPRTLDQYLKFLNVTEEEFFEWVEPMRDKKIWEKDAKGRWVANDSVVNHVHDKGVEEARMTLVAPEDRTFSEKNKHLYYSEKHWAGVKPKDPLLAAAEKSYYPGAEFVVI